MKRYGYLYNKIYSFNNLNLAELKAKRGKSKQQGVIEFNKNRHFNLSQLHLVLKSKNYKTSKYKTFKIYEKKERIISKLPYKDRVVQWAIINVIGEILNKSLITQTYSNIKHRGIHLCLKHLNIILKNKELSKYCLKVDIKKYYKSINKDILKYLLAKKFKDKDLLNLLFEIIDSNKDGLPLGNLTSQYFGNFYLNSFLHYLKQDLKIKYIFVYCDDIVVLSNCKIKLYQILNEINQYLNKLNLQLSNWQRFPIDSRGIDFLGYVSYSTHIKLRKSIKLNYIKMIKNNNNLKSRNSYNGWLKYCNSINLKNKYEHKNT